MQGEEQSVAEQVVCGHSFEVARPADPWDPGTSSPPSHSLRKRLLYRCAWFVLRTIDRVVLRTRVRGIEQGDPAGPMLLLCNHVSVFDPFSVAIQFWRPCRFMAATSVCNVPVLGATLQALGVFPKMKFVKDRQSMQILNDHYEEGSVVALFPEGVRTWTGEPMPVQPGIGRLIQRLDARVMFARLNTAYLLMPRWAKYPRFVPLEIDYEGPFQYSADATAEQIAQDVAQRLQVTPKRDRSRWAWGFRLAEGLPELLWACPHCFAQESLEVVGWRGRDVACSACRAKWRLDIDHVLHPEQGGSTLTVPQAYGRIEDHFGSPAVLTPRRRFEGIVATAKHARFRRLANQEVVAEGPLQVHTDHLLIGGHRVELRKLLSVSVDVGSQVMLRCASDTPRGDLHRLEVPGESALKWGTLVKAWRERSAGSLGG